MRRRAVMNFAGLAIVFAPRSRGQTPVNGVAHAARTLPATTWTIAAVTSNNGIRSGALATCAEQRVLGLLDSERPDWDLRLHGLASRAALELLLVSVPRFDEPCAVFVASSREVFLELQMMVPPLEELGRIQLL